MIARPFLLRRLTELRIVDDARERAFVRDGILTIADLDLAIAERRASASDPALKRAVEVLTDERRPISLGRAWDVLEPFLAAVSAQCPEIDALEPAGGVRRAESLLHNLIVVGRAVNPARAIEQLITVPLVSDVLHKTPRRALAVFDGHEIDVRIASPDEYGTVMFAATGPAQHVADVLRRRPAHLSASETDVYTHAGLAYLAPELRDWPDALDAAEHKRISRLVQREDMRGDLHMHTTYSDGRDPLRRMVQASMALGYEYIAITDHSEHAGAAHTVDLAHLEKQSAEIARLRTEYPGLTIFHGLEVDILRDATLDCPDAVMASLDIVLASLHDAGGQSGAVLTSRCLAAIRHPLVSVITHPSNRLVGHHEGYDMDFDAIYAAAAETGTALEIDGAPAHLDLTGERARVAVAAGVTVTIDSDCHRARSLDRQMRMGVGLARRGGIAPSQVLNTRSADDVRAFLARKRA